MSRRLTFTVYDGSIINQPEKLWATVRYAETLTFDQFVAKYVRCRSRGRSQIAILLTQDEGVKLIAERQRSLPGSATTASLPGAALNFSSIMVGVAYSAVQRPFRFVQRIFAGRALKGSTIAAGSPGAIQRSLRANIALARAFLRLEGQKPGGTRWSRTGASLGIMWRGLWQFDQMMQVLVPQGIGRLIPAGTTATQTPNVRQPSRPWIDPQLALAAVRGGQAMRRAYAPVTAPAKQVVRNVSKRIRQQACGVGMRLIPVVLAEGEGVPNSDNCAAGAAIDKVTQIVEEGMDPPIVTILDSAWIRSFLSIILPTTTGWSQPIRAVIGRFFPGLLTPPPAPIQEPTGRSPPNSENDALRVKQRDVVESTILESFLAFVDKTGDVAFAQQLHTMLSKSPEVLSEFVDYFYDDLHQKSLIPLTLEMFPESELSKATPEWLALVNASGDIPQQVWSSAAWPLLAKLKKTIAKVYDNKNLFGANHVLLDEATQKLLGDHLLKEIFAAFEETRVKFADTKAAFGFIRKREISMQFCE